jgi:hypothetical protein
MGASFEDLASGRAARAPLTRKLGRPIFPFVKVVRAKKLADVPRGLALFLRVSGNFGLLFLLSSPYFMKGGGDPRYPWLSLFWRFGMLLSLGLSAGAVPAYLWLGHGWLKDWDRASLRPLFRPFILLWATVVGAVAFVTFVYNWN